MWVLYEQLKHVLKLIFWHNQISQGELRRALGTEVALRLFKQALAANISKKYCNRQRTVMGQLANTIMVLKCLSYVRTQSTELWHDIPSIKQLLFLPCGVTFESDLEAKEELQHCIFATSTALSAGLFHSLCWPLQSPHGTGHVHTFPAEYDPSALCLSQHPSDGDPIFQGIKPGDPHVPVASTGCFLTCIIYHPAHLLCYFTGSFSLPALNRS